MKYFELNKEEKNIIDDFNEGNFINTATQKKKYRDYAKATLIKTKNINLRLSEKDLQKIKSRAVEKGIPYQTLLSSLIHQYADNKLKISP